MMRLTCDVTALGAVVIVYLALGSSRTCEVTYNKATTRFPKQVELFSLNNQNGAPIIHISDFIQRIGCPNTSRLNFPHIRETAIAKGRLPQSTC
ncbi:hypothetical protein J6590_084782 [Homalodisca vitripennis]|nr:hypothetical protein J6590_084782 [Homalodisca vitripennis]